VAKVTTDVRKIRGLILSGGRSSRLGYPKEKIKWHGIAQWEHLNEIISPLVDDVYLSDNKIWQSKIPTIIDSIEGRGPMGGILSALQTHSDSAWLVVACDMPLLTTEILSILIDKYKAHGSLTCFYNNKTNQAEPLPSIWPSEYKAALLKSIEAGTYSLQPHITTGQLLSISAPDFTNVNSLNDYYRVKSLLPYLPIDCNYYDHLEAAALQPNATIEFFNGKELETINDRILTTVVKDHTEYIITAGGNKIRMDMIRQINNIPNPIQ
jgi:molybdopterin-guanine dinucleotide biosynthesis protein A